VVPLLLVACGDDREVVSAPWDLARPPADRTVAFSVAIGSSSCNGLQSVEVTESEELVHLEAKVR
jgi:hypothetical protein